MPLQVIVKRTDQLSGEVKAPPSKSYTHRAILAAALSLEESVVLNPLFSDDTYATMEACKSLGVFIQPVKNGLSIKGLKKPKAPSNPINCKLSAATIRFMTAVSSLAEGKTILTGEEGLLKRPIGPLVEALNQLGVHCESKNGFPPVVVYGGNPLGGQTFIVGDVSSQFISGLLFISPLAKEDVQINLTTPLESKPYVELTLEVLKRHGIKVYVSGNHEKYIIPSGQEYKPYNHRVIGDFSSASFLMAAAAVTNSHLKIENLDVSLTSQPDLKILNILKTMGAKIRVKRDYVEIFGNNLQGTTLDAKDNPDLVPVLVVLACCSEGETTIKNVKRLRIKESDRLKALNVEFSKMGAKIQTVEDKLVIEGPCKLKGTTVDSHGDHRIAMACAVAGLAAEGETRILHAECVSKSYPNFFHDLKKLGGKVSFER